jgi:hypothetical protein
MRIASLAVVVAIPLDDYLFIGISVVVAVLLKDHLLIGISASALGVTWSTEDSHIGWTAGGGIEWASRRIGRQRLNIFTSTAADERPDRSKQMDLQKQVTISPTGERSSSPGNHIDIPKHLALFEAVRMWTNDEGIPFDIVDAGNRLTKAQIQEIAHSEAYKAKLLAFDERR